MTPASSQPLRCTQGSTQAGAGALGPLNPETIIGTHNFTKLSFGTGSTHTYGHIYSHLIVAFSGERDRSFLAPRCAYTGLYIQKVTLHG